MGEAKLKPMSEEQLHLLIEINKFQMIVEVNKAAVAKGTPSYYNKLAIEEAELRLERLLKTKQEKGW